MFYFLNPHHVMCSIKQEAKDSDDKTFLSKGFEVRMDLAVYECIFKNNKLRLMLSSDRYALSWGHSSDHSRKCV